MQKLYKLFIPTTISVRLLFISFVRKIDENKKNLKFNELKKKSASVVDADFSMMENRLFSSVQDFEHLDC